MQEGGHAGNRASQLAEVLANELEQHAGPLPSERALAARFSASRATVREALRLLEGRDLLGTRPGERSEARSPWELPAELGLADVLEARLAVEPATAKLAAQRAGPATLARLKETVQGCYAAESDAAFELTDEAFHLEVARASRSLFLVRMAQGIVDGRHAVRWGARKLNQATTRALYCQEHEAILNAITYGDPKEAEAASIRHLESVASHLTGGGHSA